MSNDWKIISYMLKVGDKVNYSIGNSIGIAKVINIDKVEPHEKYGESVDEIHWKDVEFHAVVDLDNGHWAYGSQISKV